MKRISITLLTTLLFFSGCNLDREVKSDNTSYVDVGSVKVTCVDGLEMFIISTRSGLYIGSYKRTKEDKLIECDVTKFSQQ